MKFFYNHRVGLESLKTGLCVPMLHNTLLSGANLMLRLGLLRTVGGCANTFPNFLLHFFFQKGDTGFTDRPTD